MLYEVYPQTRPTGKDEATAIRDGGLAAARGAHHRHELPLVDGEADPLEGGDPAVSSGIELRQAFNRDGFRDHCDGKSTRNR